VEETNAKLKFSESMKKIISKKPLSQVTVSEITESAGLSRKTFYQAFRDKYELAAYIWELETQKLKEGGYPGESLRERWIRFENKMKSEREFYCNLLESIDEQNSFFQSWIDICMRNPIAPKEIIEQDEDLYFAMKAFAYGGNMCLRDWLRNKCVEPPEVIARRLLGAVPVSLAPYILETEKQK